MQEERPAYFSLQLGQHKRMKMIKKNLYASWIVIFAYKGFICDASMEQGEGVSIPSKDQIKSK
tara:strand:+ start:161 stop:349 length:189 start_codon:yes stop_codon:yes gene_type:complete